MSDLECPCSKFCPVELSRMSQESLSFIMRNLARLWVFTCVITFIYLFCLCKGWGSACPRACGDLRTARRNQCFPSTVRLGVGTFISEPSYWPRLLSLTSLSLPCSFKWTKTPEYSPFRMFIVIPQEVQDCWKIGLLNF